MVFPTEGDTKVTHGYLPTYLRLASEIGVTGRVLELGVDQGASLVLWQNLFPQGIVVGVDWNEQSVWPDGLGRIVAAQNDPDLPKWVQEYSKEYDLIVDDCSHKGILTWQSWELLWPLVAPGRYYVIEDWQIGLPSTRGAVFYDPCMVELAQTLVLHLDRDHESKVDEILYRHGLIILRKKVS